jgi:hypothetical protein
LSTSGDVLLVLMNLNWVTIRIHLSKVMKLCQTLWKESTQARER